MCLQYTRSACVTERKKDMPLEKKRNSNFELLRIIAMLMIVIFHIVVHSVDYQLTDTSSMALMNNGLFNHPVFYKKLLLLTSIIPFGKMGDTVFILISGFFMIKKERIDLGKISKKLLLQLMFATTTLVISSFVCYKVLKTTYIGLIPITNINLQSWFVGYYFAVMVIAALFLNRFLGKLERKQYVTFLLVMFAVIIFGWLGSLFNNIASEIRVLLAGVFVYSLGGYIRIYEPFQKIKSSVLIAVCAGIYGLIYLSYYNAVNLNIENYILKGSKGEFIQNVMSFQDYSVVIIIMGVCLFEFFKRINIPTNRVINFLGSATFMIYLLHDNAFTYSIWNTQDWITLLYNHPLLFLLKLFGWGLAVFGIGVLVYVLFLGVGKACRKFKGIILYKNKDHPAETESQISDCNGSAT